MVSVREETGLATMLSVAIVTGFSVLVSAVVATAQLASSRAHAQMVADLAALSAARSADCAPAWTAAQLHEATVTACNRSGTDVVVFVAVQVSGPLRAFYPSGAVTAHARAGF